MKAKKPIVMAALLLAVTLVAGSLINGAAADLYYTAVNDDLKAFNDEMMPYIREGEYYLPHTLLNDRSLGVYYSFNKTNYSLTLYNDQTSITFNLLAGVAYDATNQYTKKIVIRNGSYFLPIAFVCERFGLTFSVIAASPANVVRITSGSALDDEEFLRQAQAEMITEYNAYFAAKLTPKPSVTGAVSPKPSQTIPPNTGEPPSEAAKVYLAAAKGFGEDTSGVLDTLSDAGVRVAFFLTAERIAAEPDLVRRLAAEGHSLGIDAREEKSADDVLAALNAANRAYDSVLLMKTRLCLLPATQAFAEASTADMNHIAQIAADAGYIVCGYDAAYEDENVSTSKILAAAAVTLSNLKNDEITLLLRADDQTSLRALTVYLNIGKYQTKTLTQGR